MTYLLNSPDDFADEAVRGLVAANPDLLVEVPGGVARSTQTPPGQPALVIGGGSGHYPAFAGWVGPGMGHGAPCGNIFSSPAASEVYSVVRNSENGGGVILGFGNYAGDVLHFGLAAEKLRHEGIDVRIVPVSDDIASNGPENHRDRRGVAGDLPVFKIVGAAIEAGADLDEAERLAWKANDATRSFGLAFDGCTLPGAEEPLFHVENGRMGVGLGIHGEPGVRDDRLGSADEVADLLLDQIAAEEPRRGESGYDGRVAVILNGLGKVKYEELFVVYRRIAERLEEKGLTAVRPEVGEFVTSLDMAGLSLTVVFLDDELEKLWLAPVLTPAYRRGSMPDVDRIARSSIWDAAEAEIPESSEDSRACAENIVAVLDTFAKVCAENEAELGRLDAVAGDGDHGQGMAYGSRGAARAARAAVEPMPVPGPRCCWPVRRGPTPPAAPRARCGVPLSPAPVACSPTPTAAVTNWSSTRSTRGSTPSSVSAAPSRVTRRWSTPPRRFAMHWSRPSIPTRAPRSLPRPRWPATRPTRPRTSRRGWAAPGCSATRASELQTQAPCRFRC